jgi:hypothetical protein
MKILSKTSTYNSYYTGKTKQTTSFRVQVYNPYTYIHGYSPTFDKSEDCYKWIKEQLFDKECNVSIEATVTQTYIAERINWNDIDYYNVPKVRWSGTIRDKLLRYGFISKQDAPDGSMK